MTSKMTQSTTHNQTEQTQDEPNSKTSQPSTHNLTEQTPEEGPCGEQTLLEKECWCLLVDLLTETVIPDEATRRPFTLCHRPVKVKRANAFNGRTDQVYNPFIRKPSMPDPFGDLWVPMMRAKTD